MSGRPVNSLCQPHGLDRLSHIMDPQDRYPLRTQSAEIAAVATSLASNSAPSSLPINDLRE